MIKRITIFAATALLALAMAVPAFAASPSQEQCEAPPPEGQGGTFTRSGGQVSCVVVDEGKNPKFTQETETTGQGNINNKQQSESDCEGTGSDKCPSGQFKD